MKKVISLVLSVCMLLGVCTINVEADAYVAGDVRIGTKNLELNTVYGPGQPGGTCYNVITQGSLVVTTTTDGFLLTFNDCVMSKTDANGFEVVYSNKDLNVTGKCTMNTLGSKNLKAFTSNNSSRKKITFTNFDLNIQGGGFNNYGIVYFSGLSIVNNSKIVISSVGGSFCIAQYGNLYFDSTSLIDVYRYAAGSTPEGQPIDTQSCPIDSSLSNGWVGTRTSDTNAPLEDLVYSSASGYFKVSGTSIPAFRVVNKAPIINNNTPANEPEPESGSEPEAEVELGGKNLSLEFGNDTVVFSKDAYEKTKETSMSADGKNFRLDFRDASVDVKEAIVPKDIIKDLAKQGKGLEFENRHGFMIIDELDDTTNNSVVIGVKDSVASYSQVKALGTTHVEAEFNIAYKTNGREINGDAHVYIPCDIAEPRLFYVIDDNTMGELPCRVSGGYAVFDRYLDGTYVICK